MARSVLQVDWEQHGPVESGDRRAAWRLVLSQRTQDGAWTKAEAIVVGGMDMGIDHGGGGEGHGKGREQRVITPGSGQDRATHSQAGLWLRGEVPGRQPDTGPGARGKGSASSGRELSARASFSCLCMGTITAAS